MREMMESISYIERSTLYVLCSWKALESAAEHGHLEVVQWILTTRTGMRTSGAMDRAVANGHLVIAQFAMASARNIEVQCLFATSDTSPRPRRSHVSNDQLIMLQAVYKRRPAFVKGCLRSLANIALREGNIEILDWLNQLGLHVELHTTIPIRQAVGRGDVKLLQWFYWNEFELHDPDLLHLAVQKEQLDAARWLSKHGFKITSLSLIEEAGRKEMVPMLRWLVEHGPPLNFGTAMKLTVEYFHNEIAWWVSESDRVQIVLEALQKEKQDVLGWILTRTRFENVSSQQRIRDAIQRAPESIILRIEEDLSDLEECKWCFLPTNKEALQRNGAGIFKKKARRRSVKDAAIDIVLFTPGFDNLGSIKVEAKQ
ncbi:Ankyrin repeat-containing domain [Phytophthora cactorum]|nr:Ankyrin repeat-containing domain [Phytophthora cactorum]